MLGTVYNLTGATLGAALAFLIARYLASDRVARKTGGRVKQLIDGVENEGWRFVAFVRLVPLFPFNLLNYTLGLTRLRLLPYVIASYLFMLPGAIAYTYLGYATNLNSSTNWFKTTNTYLKERHLAYPLSGKNNLINYFRGADVYDQDADGKIGRVEFERIQADLVAAGVTPRTAPLPPIEETPPPADTSFPAAASWTGSPLFVFVAEHHLRTDLYLPQVLVLLGDRAWDVIQEEDRELFAFAFESHIES